MKKKQNKRERSESAKSQSVYHGKTFNKDEGLSGKREAKTLKNSLKWINMVKLWKI